MPSITLPDCPSRTTPRLPRAVAASIGSGLAKAAIAARVDDVLVDLDHPIEHDAGIAIITARKEDPSADALE